MEKEKRDNTAREYRREYRRLGKKAKDTRQIEQMIASTNDCWKLMKQINLQQRRKMNPMVRLNEEELLQHHNYWSQMYNDPTAT